jgi:hypothetical protein
MRHYDDYRPFWRHGPRYRSGISINIDADDFGMRRGSSWARHVARCEENYRSYSAVTDQYLGSDGDYHYCRLWRLDGLQDMRSRLRR